MFTSLSFQSYTLATCEISKSATESYLFKQIFGTFNLSPTITVIGFENFHNLIQKTQFKPKTCLGCSRSIKCGADVVKCVDCGLHCHPKCERSLSIICSGSGRRIGHSCSTTSNKSKFRYPSKPPFIPYPIVHLINEIELRCVEAGLYCLPMYGSEDVRAINDIVRRFKLKKPQNLQQYNAHILANCLLQVLRELPNMYLIRHWNLQRRQNDGLDLKLQLESLPKPNRNVLILLLLHLQYISQQKISRMSLKALSAIFAPVVFENESYIPDPDGHATKKLLLQLLGLEPEYLLNVFFLNA